MKNILIQQRDAKTLEGPETYSDELKAKLPEIEDMNEIAYNSIILHLYDDIVRQVNEAKTVNLFLTETLPNKIYLLEKLISFKMDTRKHLKLNLSDFDIIVKNLAHSEKKLEDEDLVVILLNSLLESYKDVRNVIKYSRVKLIQAIVIDALRSRELKVKKESKSYSRKESMSVRERTKKRESNF